MVCTKCSRQLEDGWRFCEICGASVEISPWKADVPDLLQQKAKHQEPSQVKANESTSNATNAIEERSVLEGFAQEQVVSEQPSKNTPPSAVKINRFSRKSALLGMALVAFSCAILGAFIAGQQSAIAPTSQGSDSSDSKPQPDETAGTSGTAQAPTQDSNATESSPSATVVEQDEDEAPSDAEILDSWVTKTSLHSVSSKFFIGEACLSPFCTLHTLELRFPALPEIDKEFIEIVLDLNSEMREVVGGESISISNGDRRKSIQILERGGVSGTRTIEIGLIREGASETISRKVFVEAERSDLIKDVTQPPVDGGLTAEELKDDLVRLGVCGRFSNEEPGYSIDCFLEGEPRTVGRLLMGRNLTATTENTWRTKFTAYGPGWAFEVFDGSGPENVETYRRMGAVLFRSPSLNCDLDISDPNSISQCVSF